jgi:hypothetical protein
VFSAWFVRAPALVLLTALFVISVLDFWLEATDQPTVGDHVARWTRRYPLFAAGLALLVGAMVGHFFWQPV